MNDSNANQGFDVYSKSALSVYDWLVLGLFNRLIWRCPTRQLRALYQQNLGANHLDLGVGTGYFLRQFEPGNPLEKLVLVDANPNCLEKSRRRLASSQPFIFQCNLLDKSELDDLTVRLNKALDGEMLNSIAANYLVHCLPSGVASAANVVSWSARVLGNNGVLFGATIPAELAYRRLASRTLMNLFNRRGIFGNANDSVDNLRSLLETEFANVKIDLRGSVALFTARQATKD